MRKRLDGLFAALMLAAAIAAAIAVVLAGGWCLRHSIARARAGRAPLYTACACPDLPVLRADPLPTPTPTPVPDKPAYDPAIPLSAELQAVLREACEEADVPVALALGVIEVESRFQTDAVSLEGCYGLMQLNPKYFPDKLSPVDNLREGVAYLGQLLERYGDLGAALTAYNAGHDTGRREYANAVLDAAARWNPEK